MPLSHIPSQSKDQPTRSSRTPNNEGFDSERREPQQYISATMTPSQVLHLQRQQGNQAVLRRLGRSAPSKGDTERSQPPFRRAIRISRRAGDIVQTKLQGASSVIATAVAGNPNLAGLHTALVEYEALEAAEIARLQAALPANVENPQQQTMFFKLVSLVALVDNLLNQPLGRIPQNIQEQLPQLKRRLLLEKADLQGGRFNMTIGYSDASLNAGASTDNRYGGALNKLDDLHYNRPGGPENALYKPETARDPKHMRVQDGVQVPGHAGVPVGIPENDPNFGGRSVAMYRLDQLLNAGMIVRTEFATHRRQNLDANDNAAGPPMPSFGIVMERAAGREARQGFLTGGNVAFTGQQANTMRAHGAAQPLNLQDPVLQRGLNKLQILDALCGQVDRHNANFFIDQDAQGNVTQVKGIDNDLAFGKNQINPSKPIEHDNAPMGSFKGLPPLADRELAERIIEIDLQLIRDAVKGLLEESEIAALMARFQTLKTHLQVLRGQHKLKAPHEWDALTASAQKRQDSYLGALVDEAQGDKQSTLNTTISNILQGANWTVGEGVVKLLLSRKCGKDRIVSPDPAYQTTLDAGVEVWRNKQNILTVRAQDHLSKLLTERVTTGRLTMQDALAHANHIGNTLRAFVENNPSEMINVENDRTIYIDASALRTRGEALMPPP